MPQRPWTGIPSSTAIGVSLICVQAWSLFAYGIFIAIVGGWLSGVTDSTNTLCDSSYDSTYDYSYSSSCDTVHHAANAVKFVGAGMIVVGLILLIAVIAFMRGKRAGQVICAVTQGIFIIGAIIIASNAHNGAVGVGGALVPVIILICILAPPAQRLIAGARSVTPPMGYR